MINNTHTTKEKNHIQQRGKNSKNGNIVDIIKFKQRQSYVRLGKLHLVPGFECGLMSISHIAIINKRILHNGFSNICRQSAAVAKCAMKTVLRNVSPCSWRSTFPRSPWARQPRRSTRWCERRLRAPWRAGEQPLLAPDPECPGSGAANPWNTHLQTNSTNRKCS